MPIAMRLVSTGEPKFTIGKSCSNVGSRPDKHHIPPWEYPTRCTSPPVASFTVVIAWLECDDVVGSCGGACRTRPCRRTEVMTHQPIRRGRAVSPPETRRPHRVRSPMSGRHHHRVHSSNRRTTVLFPDGCRRKLPASSLYLLQLSSRQSATAKGTVPVSCLPAADPSRPFWRRPRPAVSTPVRDHDKVRSTLLPTWLSTAGHHGIPSHSSVLSGGCLPAGGGWCIRPEMAARRRTSARGGGSGVGRFGLSVIARAEPARLWLASSGDAGGSVLRLVLVRTHHDRFLSPQRSDVPASPQTSWVDGGTDWLKDSLEASHPVRPYIQSCETPAASTASRTAIDRVEAWGSDAPDRISRDDEELNVTAYATKNPPKCISRRISNAVSGFDHMRTEATCRTISMSAVIIRAEAVTWRRAIS